MGRTLDLREVVDYERIGPPRVPPKRERFYKLVGVEGEYMPRLERIAKG